MHFANALARIIRIYFSEVVRSGFSGGIMPSSIIDRKKFARLFQEKLSFPFPVNYEDEEAITALCSQECVPAGKKYYAIADNAKQKLADILDELARSGRNTIYCENLYRHHASEFLNMGIGSPQILEGCLKKFFSHDCAYGYFSFNENETLAVEAMRSLEDEIRITPEICIKRLPFIHWDDVRAALLASGQFMLQKKDLLIRKSSIQFDEAELEKVYNGTIERIAETGYMPIKSINFSRTQMENPDIAPEAILSAFIDRLALEGYEKRGPGIRKINTEPIAKMITAFCEQVDHFTYSELRERFGADTFSLRHLLWYAQKSAFQIDQENFVNLDNIKLVVSEIDSAINELRGDTPFTLLSFNEFFALPIIQNFAWNHYLLQSFFIHASCLFSIKQPASNNSCIGIIYKKELFKNFDYSNLGALIAKFNHIDADYKVLSDYAIKSGLYGAKRASAINNLLSALQSLH